MAKKPYEVVAKNVGAEPVLVVRRQARPVELSRVVPEACGLVWNFIREHRVPNPGRNVAVYLNGAIDLEVGVEVGPDATGTGEVILSATPAGPVATRCTTDRMPTSEAPIRRFWIGAGLKTGHSPARAGKSTATGPRTRPSCGPTCCTYWGGFHAETLREQGRGGKIGVGVV